MSSIPGTGPALRKGQTSPSTRVPSCWPTPTRTSGTSSAWSGRSTSAGRGPSWPQPSPPRAAGGTAGPASLEAEVFSPRPNGPAAAALLAGAVGVFVLGLNTFVAAAAEGAKEWLTFQNRVGSLSGKTTMAGGVWLVGWG